jgi:hypothetical protein
LRRIVARRPMVEFVTQVADRGNFTTMIARRSGLHVEGHHEQVVGLAVAILHLVI